MARISHVLLMASVFAAIALAGGAALPLSVQRLEGKTHAELCALSQGKPSNESVNMAASCRAAVLAGGSFLRLELGFRHQTGVITVLKGYTGGFAENPTFEDVTRGTTGHAEAVMVVFNANLTSYDEVLGVFWLNHLASTKDVFNVEGLDKKTHSGTQFRSNIFAIDAAQKTTAARAKKMREQAVNETLATTIEDFSGVFWAESRLNKELLRVRTVIEAETVNVTTAAANVVEATLAATLPVATQGAGRDDAVAVEASKLDEKGKLFGAARDRWLEKLRNQSKQRAQSKVKRETTSAAALSTAPPPKPTVKKPAAQTDGLVDDVASLDETTTTGAVPQPPPPTTAAATTVATPVTAQAENTTAAAAAEVAKE